MKKRLFMAVPLSDDTTAALQQFIQKHRYLGQMMKSPARSQQGIASVRWTAPENLHITTYFLGDTDEEKIPALKECIKKVLTDVHAFELEWKEAIFMPPRPAPHMIWGELYGNPEFTLLVNKCYEASKPFINPITAEKLHPEQIPHITLARFNDSRVADGVTLEQPISGEVTNRATPASNTIGSIVVKTVHLMASELKREGPKYTILKSYELT